MAATISISLGLAMRRSANDNAPAFIASTMRGEADIVSSGTSDKKISTLPARKGEMARIVAVSGDARITSATAAATVSATTSPLILQGDTLELLMDEGQSIAFVANS